MSEGFKPGSFQRVIEITREQFEESTENLRAREALYKYVDPPMYDPTTEARIAEMGIIPIEKHMIDAMRLRGDERILDAGCGDGSLMLFLHDYYGHRGPQLGIDLHLNLFKKRRAAMGKKIIPIELMQADAQSIPLPDNSVDVVFSSFVAYHVPDVLQMLRELRRVLVPGGSLGLATRGPDNLSALWYLGEVISMHLGNNERYLGIEPPGSFYTHFDIGRAAVHLPQEGFDITDAYVQKSIIRLRQEEWNEFRRALLSLRKSFKPQPERAHMNRVVNRYVRPFFNMEVEDRGSYDMWAEQAYFICRNTK